MQYDIYYGIVWGTRTAFEIGLIVTGATVLIGDAFRDALDPKMRGNRIG